MECWAFYRSDALSVDQNLVPTHSGFMVFCMFCLLLYHQVLAFDKNDMQPFEYGTLMIMLILHNITSSFKHV